ncbi:hypothetical protein T440DRAFT_393703 [Plenodomus tracheiphilus IPT5]|uniref:Chromatin assembly factor 1 subunit A n=1 Tax=Plenodomus tracheiphilus IPT5 TaxID=1408161 RepID=A0A6A7BCZ9_9PLEO|nr:hypothetical protein T440DRAFT_393703 [Plenodomus tracheiphilus IPT5]
MEDSTPAAPTAQKRPLEEDVAPSTPLKAIRSEASTPLSVLSVLSVQTPSPLRGSAPTSTAPTSTDTAQSTSQSAKRRKLTSQEKEQQRLEKEAKAKAREDKKAQREAEDKLKAEQKAQKEEEKRKKAEERDEKKRQKEEEAQQKEEEKLKKERSQMKLNAFFAKPKDTGSNGRQEVVESIQNPVAQPLSLLPDRTGAGTNSLPSSPQKKIVKNAQSDYDRYFLPFNLPAHTILAPINAFLDDPAKVEAARSRLDELFSNGASHDSSVTQQTLRFTFSSRQRRGFKTATITEIIDCVNGSSEQPIDLTADANASPGQPLEMLKDIPMKYIHFPEDVRPPYYGTYTKAYEDAEARRLARNPISRVRKDTQYDYDSEAEWEEPEEGEDLDSDGEDDGDEEIEDDMDGFLDDEEDPQLKRRLISGDLVPVSTGLCWEDPDHVSQLNDGSGAICTDFKDFTIGYLFEQQPVSIDPFSTSYWSPESSKLASATTTTSKGPTGNGPMNPPRAPLAQRTMNGLLNTLNTPSTPQASSSKPAKAKRMIPPEQLPAFRAEVDGKDLTKIGMIEALKKAFPKLPKDAISNTLSVIAARVGPTEKEKRWVLINT